MSEDEKRAIWALQDFCERSLVENGDSSRPQPEWAAWSMLKRSTCEASQSITLSDNQDAQQVRQQRARRALDSKNATHFARVLRTALACMKTLSENESEVARLESLIGATAEDLPTYGRSRDFGYPHIKIVDGPYHFVVIERGQELERRSSDRCEDLLYWIFESATHNLAFAYELRNRIEDQDCRRMASSIGRKILD